MESDSRTRPYRKTARARREEETRSRITEAAVELHQTVGPAATTVTDVAKLAGVSRMTVYNHFPTEVDLFTACSTHWATHNPFPDPSDWGGVDDPEERLSRALLELYGWFDAKEEMLGKVFRDTPTLPALQEVMGRLWSPHVEAMVAALADGWVSEGSDSPQRQALLRLVLDFNSWRVLIEAGLDTSEAAELASRMVACTDGTGERG